ncbi:hypothetical protein [Stenotrophomonas maltophilia]|uniref:hypothetical protein n=1 Tax=Stenotrophomonas maltophilia TaxID=40324 RepID=UPI003B9E22DA
MNRHYGRVRQLFRQLGLRDSLKHLWTYSLHIAYGYGLPFEYRHSQEAGKPITLKDHVYDFHLDLHAREVLLHAGKSDSATHTLQSYTDLAPAHNAILAQVNSASAKTKDVYLELHRIGHQQISAFDRPDMRYIGRYWSFYRREPVASFVHQALGMTVLEYFLFATASLTMFLRRPETDLIRDLAPLGLPHDALMDRISAVSATPTHMRDLQIKRQCFGDSWSYTLNPLAERPLIQISPNEPRLLTCPRPPLLVRRLFSGLYYDLVKVSGFDKAFGDSVEHLVGELIARSAGVLNPVKPDSYHTRSGIKHGTDWILSDATGHVFVECKTARIPLAAKVAATPDELSKGLSRLADAVVQNYQNVCDATAGKTSWTPTGMPVFSLIVTLEDWVLFSEIATKTLDSLVRMKLAAKGLSCELMVQTPYLVASVRDIPNLTRAFAETGISDLFTSKTSQQYDGHLVSSFLDVGKGPVDVADSIFTEDFEVLMKEFRNHYEPPSPLTGSTS